MNKYEDVLAERACQYVLSGKYDLAEEIFQNYSGDSINEVYSKYINKMFYDKEFYRHYQNSNIYYHTVDIKNDPCPPYREYSKYLKKFSEDDKDRRLLICGVMPLGDQIFFTRFLPLIENITKNITVITSPRLIDHFTKAFPDIKFIDYYPHHPVHEFDCVLYMPFIPMFAFSKNNLSVKPLEPTAISDKDKVNKLKSTAQIEGKTIIGFSWKSSRNTHTDYNDVGSAKSLMIKQLLPFFSIPNTVFINLQHGDYKLELNEFFKKYEIDNIITLEGLDMMSTTQHIVNYVDMCDFVISPANTLIHIAGALHKKTFALVPNKKSTGRLWMYHDIPINKKHFFYPTIKMYEQDDLYNWDSAIKNAKIDLIEEIYNSENLHY